MYDSWIKIYEEFGYFDEILSKSKKINVIEGEKKKILLNYRKDECLVWEGQSVRDQTRDEDCLVLNFDGQDFYFYSSNIIVYIYTKNINLINYRTQLSIFNQEKLVNSFSKFIDANNFYYQILLLKIKTEFLINFFNFLPGFSKSFKKDFFSITEISRFKNEINILYDKILLLNSQFEKNDESLEEKKNQNLLKFFEECTKEFDLLFKPSIQIFKIINEQINVEGKNAPLIIEKTKIIFLTENEKDYLLWKGNNKKSQNIDEDPLVLNFRAKDFYFYSSGIKQLKKSKKLKKSVLNKDSISFKNKLICTNKQKVITAFSRLTDQKNLYYQKILLELKIVFLDNKIKELSKYFHNEKKIFSQNDSFFKLMFEALDKEIFNFNDQFIYLDNKISLLKSKIEILQKNLIKNSENFQKMDFF